MDGYRPQLRSSASTDTPSSLQHLEQHVRERLDAITPIGRDEGGNFLFNHADQRVVNRLVMAGAVVDRNGRVTGIPEGVDLSHVLEEEGSQDEALCCGVTPRTFAVIMVFSAVLIGLIAIVGAVIGVTMQGGGGGGGKNSDATTSGTERGVIAPTFPPTTPPSPIPTSFPPHLPLPPLRTEPTASPDDVDTDCSSLCADGSQVTLPDRVIGKESVTGKNLTCGDVDNRFGEFVHNGCNFLHVRGAARCGCRGPPPATALCWICHDDAPLAPERTDTVVLNLDSEQSVTCGDVAVDLGTDENNSDEACLQGQIWGSLACGCSSPHPQAKCWICPDGSVPSALSSNNATLRAQCINHSEAIARIDDEGICKAQVQIWAPQCGCPTHAPSSLPTTLPPSKIPTAAPSLAPSNAPSSDPSNAPLEALSLAPTKTPSLSPSVGFNDDVTCRTLCADGSSVPFPERFFNVDPTTGKNRTCGEIESNFAFFANEEGCKPLQFTAAIRCGCPGSPPVQEIVSCWICHDNSTLPVEQFDQVAFVTPSDVAVTCATVALSLVATIHYDPTCFTGQLLGTLSCGCPSPHPQAKCWICPDGSLPSALSGSDPVLKLTCREQAERMARIEDEAECQEEVNIWAPQCGCKMPSMSPSSSPSEMVTMSPTETPLDTNCTTVCPDGSPMPFPDNRVGKDPLTEREITCREFESDVEGYIATRGCHKVHTAGIVYCGCPGPPTKETLCWICYDNTTVIPVQENVDTVVAQRPDGSLLTCGAMAYDLAVDTNNLDGVCSIVQIFGSLSCGCPSPHPQAKCWICPDGGPTAPSDSLRNVCLDAADAIAQIDDEVRCEQEVNSWASLCGCSGLDRAKTSLPSSSPSTTAAPTTTSQPTSMSLLLSSTAPTTKTSSAPTVTFTSCGGVCADGSRVTFPDFVAVPAESPTVDPTTCGVLERGLDNLVANNVAENGPGVADGLCFTAQVIGSYRCGCISPHPRATCWFACPGLDGLPQDKLDNVVAVDTEQNPLTCMNLALASVNSSEEACADMLEQFSKFCCDGA